VRRVILALLLALATAACTPTRAAPSAADGAATVVEVSDGDTIDVDLGGSREAVRLLGIDTSNPANLHPGFTPP